MLTILLNLFSVQKSAQKSVQKTESKVTIKFSVMRKEQSPVTQLIVMDAPEGLVIHANYLWLASQAIKAKRTN